jgi:protein tyrosine/serine phosphatase
MHSLSPLTSSSVIKEGILYRSARLDLASSADRELLRDLDIKSVIDLRTKYALPLLVNGAA